MNVTVGTISGGYFVYQLASLLELSKTHYEEELYIGGSGGAICGYINSAASSNYNSIRRVIRSMDSKLFVSEESKQSIMPKTISTLIRGSVYESSSYSSNILSTYFTKDTVQEKEIWTCSINKKTRGVLLCCNRSYINAMIKSEYMNQTLFKYEPVCYAGGNIKLINKNILATSCVPTFIKPVEIDNEYYIDCGVNYGSALTPLKDEVISLSRERKGIHIIYLSGCDVTTSSPIRKNLYDNKGNMFDDLMTLPSHIVIGQIEKDRSVAIEIVGDSCMKNPWYSDKFCSNDLPFLLERSKSTHSSMIEIYPKGKRSANIFDFNGEDLMKLVDKCRKELGVRLWWTGYKNTFDKNFSADEEDESNTI